MQYYFYIIFSSAAGKYYISHTADLSGRLRRHNTDHKGYTGHYSDWDFVYTEPYPTKQEAYNREREVKTWKSRKRIEQLIQKGLTGGNRV